MNLEGKFAVVTGGGSSIGLAITKALRAAGSDVLIVGRNETRLNAAGGDDSLILTVAADLANPDDRVLLIEQLRRGRPLDILVNNAGSMTRIDLHNPNAQSLLEHDVAHDLAAPVHLSLALLPVLRQRPEAAHRQRQHRTDLRAVGVQPRLFHRQGGLARLHPVTASADSP